MDNERTTVTTTEDVTVNNMIVSEEASNSCQDDCAERKCAMPALGKLDCPPEEAHADDSSFSDDSWSETNEPEVIINELEASSGQQSMGGSFKCERCSETFPDKHMRRVHRRIHVRLQCKKCFKNFQSRRDLERHNIGVHDNVKDYLCKTCGKTFSHVSTLKQHETLHLGIRPHVCAFCGFAFTDKSHLATHVRIHTGERPYECDLCKKTFARIGYLRTHVRTHTKEKNHTCSICDRSFLMSYHLKCHMGTHTKEKPYRCDECDSSFARRSNVNRHKKKFHPAEQV